METLLTRSSLPLFDMCILSFILYEFNWPTPFLPSVTHFLIIHIFILFFNPSSGNLLLLFHPTHSLTTTIHLIPFKFVTFYFATHFDSFVAPHPLTHLSNELYSSLYVFHANSPFILHTLIYPSIHPLPSISFSPLFMVLSYFLSCLPPHAPLTHTFSWLT